MTAFDWKKKDGDCAYRRIAKNICVFQCCPDLSPYGVGRATDKGFDLEVLFEGLEEQLDLSAVLVDGGDGLRLAARIGAQPCDAADRFTAGLRPLLRVR